MATTSFYTLFESASGYGLFSILETEEIGAFLEEVSASPSKFHTSVVFPLNYDLRFCSLM